MTNNSAQDGPTPPNSRYAHLFGGRAATSDRSVSAELTAESVSEPMKLSAHEATGNHEPAGDHESAGDHEPAIDTQRDSPERRPSRFSVVEKWLGRFVATVITLAVIGALIFGSVALVDGSWQVNPILSGSMRPGLPVGGVVISERVPVNQLAVRDVIVFREPDSPTTQIVHRIINMTRNASGQLLITTQGDANNVRDPWTLTIKGDYAYRARWSIPLVGYVAVAYENNRGVALIVAGAILIAVAITTIWKPRRRVTEPTSSDDEPEADPIEVSDAMFQHPQLWSTEAPSPSTVETAAPRRPRHAANDDM